MTISTAIVSQMTPSDYIQIAGIFVAFFLGIASIVISVVSIRQNTKMIEESTRPVISVYPEYINTSTPTFYLVIKNFGQTQAYITKFSYDFDFVGNDAYGFGESTKDFLLDLNTATFAPGQSRICALVYHNINKPVTFNVEYKTASKTYTDCFTINLKASVTMPVGKSNSKEPLRDVSYTLQEMLQKSL